MPQLNKKIILVSFAIIALLIFLYGCAESNQPATREQIGSGAVEIAEGKGKPAVRKDEPEISQDAHAIIEWRNTLLTDIRTGNKFKISDFRDKPILMESFAVWCPVCTKQQKEFKKFKDAEPDSAVHISLDTDPNEDEAKVKEHLARNNFDWYYAVAPADMSKALIKEFGLTIVSAPSAPVVLVCENQDARLLDNGVKSAEELKLEVSKGC